MASASADQRLAATIERYLPGPAGAPALAPQTRVFRRIVRPGSELAWIRGDGAQGDEAVVKVVRRATPQALARLERSVFAARQLADALPASEVEVLLPVAYFPDLGSIVTKAVNAPDLFEDISRHARWFPSEATLARLERGCRLAGSWVRVLQDATVVETRRFEAADLVSYIDIRLERLRHYAWPWGVNGAFANTIRTALQAMLEGDAPLDRKIAIAHGDFSPSNLLFDGTRLVVLDLTEFQSAPRLLDVTRFVHQLQLLTMQLIFRPATIERLQMAFLSAYTERDVRADQAFVPFMIRHDLTHWWGRVKSARSLRQRLSILPVCLRHRASIRRRLKARA